jgi:membrane protein YqaA with SNARE-associated domain
MNNWLKKFHVWSLQWANTKWGTWSLFICAFADASFLPLPTPMFFLALALLNITKTYTYALFATLGTLSGAIAGYSIGHFAWISPTGEFTGFADFFFNNIPGFSVNLFDSIKALFNKWDFWVIFTAGFTPIPYKVFTVTAGVFDINLMMFFIASVVSRGARFFLVAWLLWKFGPGIKRFLEKYFNILALGFTACLIGGVVVIKYFL